MSTIGQNRWQLDHVCQAVLFDELTVSSGVLVASVGPCVEVTQLDSQHRSLKSIESAVEANFDMIVTTEVTVNSPANAAGLAVGDRILMVNGAEADPAMLDKVVLTAPALLLLAGAGGTRHVLVDPYGTQTGIRPVGGANVLDPDVVVF